jgi:hypothetical protein
MDYVKDAKPLLKKLERNRIGLKRCNYFTPVVVMCAACY